MSQEQIVIAGVIALNLVLLILLVTAYRLLTTRTPSSQAYARRPSAADEIQSLEAMLAHDSWPDDQFVGRDQFFPRPVDGFKE